jgi:trimethylamine:corrinoid methyltransferase-like protein
VCADGYDIGKDITLGGEGQEEKKKKKKTVTASQKCPSSPLFLKSVACKCMKAPMSEKYFSLSFDI